MLQKCLPSYVKSNKANFFPDIELVFSTLNETPCSSTNINVLSLCTLLRDDIEEADVKIILHMSHAVKDGFTDLYVISSDIYIIVLM